MAEERTDTDCAPVRPDSDRDRESRPETERREVDERDEDREDACELLRAEALLEPRPPPAIPVGGELTIPFGDTTGARPQVSQYSSPPPMSS
ncbi:hypothetical protein [Streptomyces drozdowiczii]|uniref:hypothetical protein n=1 Tax=Streptomyces drozdowiczii TaxID=202862 RepID=UPI003D2F0E0A